MTDLVVNIANKLLREQVVQLEQELEAVKRELAETVDKKEYWRSRAYVYKRQIASWREVLAFYADPITWQWGFGSTAYCDGGQRAREALGKEAT
jgi:hypothetical protein